MPPTGARSARRGSTRCRRCQRAVWLATDRQEQDNGTTTEVVTALEQRIVVLEAALREVDLNLPAVPVISNVTAQPHATAGEILQRLVEQVTSPVRWEASIRHLIEDGFARFIELGPGTALTGFMRRIDRSLEVHNVADVSSLKKTVAALTE